MEVAEIGDSVVRTLNGAQIVVESLKAEGVEVIFGYPGGAVLSLYDALYGEEEIKHILTRHEQGAVHAADGYARATGKCGVVFATSGPGATNLVTGIANAYMDSVPLVAITGQVASGLIGKDSFQEADITGITQPITKYSYLVKDVKDLARIMREAFHIATTGRPGPVVVDLPKDIAAAETEFIYPPEVNLPGYKYIYNGITANLTQAVKAVNQAERPVIYAGGGIIAAGAHEELIAFAEKINAPVTTTLMGKGAFPDVHPLALGMPGMHGTAYANYAITDSDLVIGLGVRFDDRVTGRLDMFAPNATIIHVDIDPAEISKNIRADIPLVGNVREVLADLLKEVEPRQHQAWLDKVEQWRRNHPLNYDQDNEVIKPQYVVEQICDITRGEAFIATEVGQNQMWAAQFYQCKYPRRFISSGGLGTMGFGLPAAIGVQLAHPDSVVFNIAGDGSIQMNSQEFATAVQYGLPIKVAILNNHYLGMVRQWQELFYDRRYSYTHMEGGPDFVKLAEAYGAQGMRVERPEDVRPALERAMAAPGTFVIEFIVDEEENVFPMVPAGGAINKMLGGGKR
ncbi:biosynthetic-type acetolactate synthase large subunit [Metallumcola ferriviriculae]|uniref:Acetolactate synthase n=1 Tax=Metallumcola ferriviriculae TaxID=3039180 RepID=A0AAU0UJ83_9FIRM|nr:biosynthetic-type acetolactate synthase large subunit [Desulfitibacteraceae bacterium MK1]